MFAKSILDAVDMLIDPEVFVSSGQIWIVKKVTGKFAFVKHVVLAEHEIDLLQEALLLLFRVLSAPGD